MRRSLLKNAILPAIKVVTIDPKVKALMVMTAMITLAKTLLA